jgi:drug/metabolite transporter (DMT)-like permease
LAPLLLLFGGRTALKLKPRAAVRCLLLGAIGLVGANYFYYLAIEKTTVATAIILQYSAPVWVLIYMALRGLQTPTLRRITAVGAAVAGSALAIGVAAPGQIDLNVIGVLAAMGAALSFAFYNIFGRTLVSEHPRWKVVAYALLGSALVWVVLNPPWRVLAANYSGDQWAFLIVFAFLSMLIPFSFYFAGLQYLDATRAIVTSCLEPVFAVGIAAVFLGERAGWLQIVGMMIVLAATIVIQLPDAAEQSAERATAS